MAIYRKGDDQFELEHRALLQGDEESSESKGNKEILRDNSIKVRKTKGGKTALRKETPARTEYTRGGKEVKMGGTSYELSGYTEGISGRDVADVRAERSR